MSLELFHGVPVGAIETLFDEQNQSLFKRAELGKYLGIENIKNNFKDFPSHYTCHRLEIQEGSQTSPLGRTKNPHDIFINLDGSIEMAVQSKEPKAALVKWLSKKGVEKIQEEHQKAITDCDNQIQAHQQAIEEKDATISLLHDDLKNREYENVALQAQKDVYQAELQKYQDIITHLQTRYVSHARNPGKDNIIIVRKHTTPANDKFHGLPYYIARIQRRKKYVKLRGSDRHYSDHEIIVEIDNANSIHSFNRFEEKGHAE